MPSPSRLSGNLYGPFGRRFEFCALLALLSLIGLSGCGHFVRGAANFGGRPFDLSNPPACVRDASPPPPEEAAIRYLGAGGLAIEWRGAAVLTGPFFSNYSLPRVLLGRISPREDAIGEGLAGVPVSRVGAILAGHSHYDHLGDLPFVATTYARGAKIYVNQTGANLLAPFKFGDRVVSFESRPGEWTWLTDAEGRQAPIRFLAIRSEHAPQVLRYHWRSGQVAEPLATPWAKLPIRRLKEGTTFAFVIDLMASDLKTVEFRIYYQDAASPAGQGMPPEFEPEDRHPFDLAVLCMASYDRVRDAPGWLLEKLRPRHVLVAHYEDFFRQKPVRFVPPLTDRRANRYLGIVEKSLAAREVPPGPPLGEVCSPSSRYWTVPLPGERFRFAPLPMERSDPE